MDSVVHTKLTMLGTVVEQDVRTTVYTDLAMKPVFETFVMSSGGTTTRVEAVFKPDVVECRLYSQGQPTKKSVPIPPGAKLVGDSSMYGTGAKKVQVGDKETMHYFNPLSLTIDALAIEGFAPGEGADQGQDL